MSDRPMFDLGNAEILSLGRRAVRKGNIPTVKAALDELNQRSSAAAARALDELGDAAARSRRKSAKPKGRKRKMVDAPAPCLYAIKLRKNPKGAGLYVGMSTLHSAQCKASIHMTGSCICGVTDSPNRYQRRPVPRKYGLKLHSAQSMPSGIDRDHLEDAEEAWAQNLATSLGTGVWCNGRLFS